jgi:antitoxin component HigA of HigAB toxin-antitoxin module
MIKNKFEIFPIKNEDDFDKAVFFIENNRPTTKREIQVYEAMLQLVEYYDKKYHALPKPPPSKILAELMMSHSLTQIELSKILKTKQPNVSAILKNQRNISNKQAYILEEYFHIKHSVFLNE